MAVRSLKSRCRCRRSTYPSMSRRGNMRRPPTSRLGRRFEESAVLNPLPPSPEGIAALCVGHRRCRHLLGEGAIASRPVGRATARATHGRQPGIAVPIVEQRVATRPLRPRNVLERRSHAGAGRDQLGGIVVICDRHIKDVLISLRHCGPRRRANRGEPQRRAGVGRLLCPQSSCPLNDARVESSSKAVTPDSTKPATNRAMSCSTECGENTGPGGFHDDPRRPWVACPAPRS
jgi:hypothetical protein